VSVPCIAYNESGEICGMPACAVDEQRGGMVCPHHASPETLESMRDRGRFVATAMISALWFYADPGHYQPDDVIANTLYGAATTSPIEDDRGRTARQALGLIPSERRRIEGVPS